MAAWPQPSQQELTTKAIAAASNRYQVTGELGKGGFATVYRAIDIQNWDEVAIKCLYIAQMPPEKICATQRYLLKELTNHRILAHPNISALREVFLVLGNSPQDRMLCIVMDLGNAGCLLHHVNFYLQKTLGAQAAGVDRNKGMPEAEARWFFQQLVSTMDYLHKKGVYHRDIKLENVLLHVQKGERQLKVCDFGLSKHSAEANSIVGTPQYYAPELLTSRLHEMHQGSRQIYNSAKLDVWCAGVMLYTCLMGKYPFLPPYRGQPSAADVTNFLRQIDTFKDTYVRELSPEANHLLQGLLDKNPETRFSIEQIKEDDWFKVGLANNRYANFEANQQYVQQEPVCLQSDQELEELVNRTLAIMLGHLPTHVQGDVLRRDQAADSAIIDAEMEKAFGRG